MKIVSFLGKKGGVGKTTNAHAAAHGLSMAGIPAAYVLTGVHSIRPGERGVVRRFGRVVEEKSEERRECGG